MKKQTKKIFNAIGLMSGTSCDGVDAALIVTDGYEFIKLHKGITLKYSPELQAHIKKPMVKFSVNELLKTEAEITKLHAQAVKKLLSTLKLKPNDIDVIGFHGQTITHLPDINLTWQIGNIPMLAAMSGINVVGDLRRKDIAHGGQGAPLVPVFLKAVTSNIKKPILFLNIGGVANICYITDKELIAFDVGPGNAPLDDLVYQRLALPCDKGGKIASTGKVHSKLVANFLNNRYYRKNPPKSLDRNHFDFKELYKLATEDAAATITEIIATSVLAAYKHLTTKPTKIIVTGGGAKNKFLMHRLSTLLNASIVRGTNIGVDENMAEAYAFGYLAVRSLLNLPITFPTTTGVHQPQSGGVFCHA